MPALDRPVFTTPLRQGPGLALGLQEATSPCRRAGVLGRVFCILIPGQAALDPEPRPRVLHAVPFRARTGQPGAARPPARPTPGPCSSESPPEFSGGPWNAKNDSPSTEKGELAAPDPGAKGVLPKRRSVAADGAAGPGGLGRRPRGTENAKVERGLNTSVDREGGGGAGSRQAAGLWTRGGGASGRNLQSRWQGESRLGPGGHGCLACLSRRSQLSPVGGPRDSTERMARVALPLS